MFYYKQLLEFLQINFFSIFFQILFFILNSYKSNYFGILIAFGIQAKTTRLCKQSSSSEVTLLAQSCIQVINKIQFK